MSEPLHVLRSEDVPASPQRPRRRWDDRPGAIPSLTFARYLTTNPSAAEALKFLVGLLSWPVGACGAWLLCPCEKEAVVCSRYEASISLDMGSAVFGRDVAARLSAIVEATGGSSPVMWTSEPEADDLPMVAWPLGLAASQARILVLLLAAKMDPDLVSERTIGVPEALAVYLSGSTADLGLPCIVPRSASDEPSLTARQAEVLRLLADGLTMRQISNRIGFSESTARSESLAIYRALGVHDRKAAVATATRLELL